MKGHKHKIRPLCMLLTGAFIFDSFLVCNAKILCFWVELVPFASTLLLFSSAWRILQSTAPRTKSSRLAQLSSFPAPSSIVSCNTANKTESQIVQSFFFVWWLAKTATNILHCSETKDFHRSFLGMMRGTCFEKLDQRKKKFFEINFAQLEHREHHGFCSETKD